MRLPVYFDNHATTPMDERVFDAMVPYFREKFGNAASHTHAYGWDAEAAVNVARKEISALINASPEEITFTSGATESNNLALKGVAEAHHESGGHIIIAATEHRSVLDTCHFLERKGFIVKVVPVDRDGFVHIKKIEEVITPKTILISIMMANNEIGTIASVAQIGSLCVSRGILFHTDAVQAAAYLPIDVKGMHIDLLSLSAHKMYGPKGIGALYIHRRYPRFVLIPQIHGGGHEGGFRSGTLNVPAIVGFGKAAAIAREELYSDSDRLTHMRDRFISGLLERIEEIRLNGHLQQRLPNNVNVTIAGISADTLMMELKDIAFSSGSACSSSNPEPSYVLRALGLEEGEIKSSIRIGLGRFTTEEEVTYGIKRISEEVVRLRQSRSHPQKKNASTQVLL
ncbi:MAG: IscS subfamily cysteine desulfurase [Bacteroidota bacterium]